MKISAQDEYGLRILLRIGRADKDQGLSIPQLSELEGLSVAYVGKLTRVLRIGGFIESTRGQKGGYILTRPAEEIKINDVLNTLGGRLFDEKFCGGFSGKNNFCTNSVDCSVRSLWKIVQFTVDHLLETITLSDLIGTEGETKAGLREKLEAHLESITL
ncbi:MAG: Rrf2 family transcriptional regulator [Saprospiraceae bacterium]|nr:Rrf2 family transcriptional regulator [Saprospiraceae bacterium]